MKSIQNLLIKSQKTELELYEIFKKNKMNQVMLLPQIEPNPFSNKIPNSMDIYNRLEKPSIEEEILPQTLLYLNYFKNLLKIQDSETELSIGEILDFIVINFYDELKEYYLNDKNLDAFIKPKK